MKNSVSEASQRKGLAHAGPVPLSKGRCTDQTMLVRRLSAVNASNRLDSGSQLSLVPFAQFVSRPLADIECLLRQK